MGVEIDGVMTVECLTAGAEGGNVKARRSPPWMSWDSFPGFDATDPD